MNLGPIALQWELVEVSTSIENFQPSKSQSMVIKCASRAIQLLVTSYPDCCSCCFTCFNRDSCDTGSCGPPSLRLPCRLAVISMPSACTATPPWLCLPVHQQCTLTAHCCCLEACDNTLVRQETVLQERRHG